jgi:hypothetical protein
MDAVVKVLLDKETLDAKEVENILRDINRTLGIDEPLNVQGGGGATPPPSIALDDGKIEQGQPTLVVPQKDEPPDAAPGLTPSFA